MYEYGFCVCQHTGFIVLKNQPIVPLSNADTLTSQHVATSCLM